MPGIDPLRLLLGVVLLLATGRAEARPEANGPSPGYRLPADALDIKVIETENDRHVLQIKNRTPFMVYVYIHNVRIGWLKPYRTGKMRGLKSGTHRIYAHSRFGSAYWGPRALWIPGVWNLYR